MRYAHRPFLLQLRFSVSLLTAGCVADETTPNPSAVEREPQAAADAGRANAAGARDSGATTRGAGMPIVPIHRADAGSTRAHDAATAAAPASNPPPVQVGATDAGRDSGTGKEPARDAGAALPPARPQPIHRYSFSGTGNTAHDEHAGPDAIIQGDAQLDGEGAAEFPEQGDGVVKLPDGFLSDVTDFTALVWLEARSEACWQRALDVTHVQQPVNGPGGSPMAPEITSLYLTPFGCPDALPTLGYVNSASKYHLISQAPVAQSELVQLGLSFAASSRTLRLIVNGVVEREQTVPVDVRALQRASVWLGRSHVTDDPPLHGSITELRIYNSALDASTLAQLFEHGPDSP